MNEKTVLAIDPGSSKCGMALVKRLESGELELLWRVISPSDSLILNLRAAEQLHRFDLVIIGNGTASEAVIRAIRDEALGAPILVVDEKETTLHARERYWMNTKRKGWRRFLPATLQVPPEAIDDFAAYILAERVLQSS
jgi:RNase H-fold protein (predicted Holliday junction resolvase)